MAMSEMATTGMDNRISECVVRVYYIPSYTFTRRYVQILAWADTLLVTHKTFPTV